MITIIITKNQIMKILTTTTTIINGTEILNNIDKITIINLFRMNVKLNQWKLTHHPHKRVETIIPKKTLEIIHKTERKIF